MIVSERVIMSLQLTHRRRMKSDVLVVMPHHSSFIDQDVRILQSRFDVSTFLYDQPSNRFGLLRALCPMGSTIGFSSQVPETARGLFQSLASPLRHGASKVYRRSLRLQESCRRFHSA